MILLAFFASCLYNKSAFMAAWLDQTSEAYNRKPLASMMIGVLFALDFDFAAATKATVV